MELINNKDQTRIIERKGTANTFATNLPSRIQDKIRKKAQNAIFNTKKKKAFVKIVSKKTNRKRKETGDCNDNESDNMSIRSSRSRFNAPMSISINNLKEKNHNKFQSERGSILTGSDSNGSDPNSIQLLDGLKTSGREIQTPLSRFASKKEVEKRDSIFTLELDDSNSRRRKGSLRSSKGGSGFLSPGNRGKSKRSRNGISRFAAHKNQNSQRSKDSESKDESSYGDGDVYFDGAKKLNKSGFESIQSSFQECDKDNSFSVYIE